MPIHTLVSSPFFLFFFFPCFSRFLFFSFCLQPFTSARKYVHTRLIIHTLMPGAPPASKSFSSSSLFFFLFVYSHPRPHANTPTRPSARSYLRYVLFSIFFPFLFLFLFLRPSTSACQRIRTPTCPHASSARSCP